MRSSKDSNDTAENLQKTRDWWVNKFGGAAFSAEGILEYQQIADLMPIGAEAAFSIGAVLLFGKTILKIVAGDE